MSKTRGEILRFLLVGATTVLIDFVVYRLIMFAGIATGAAKAMGFLTGTVFAYFVNRLWTFGATEQSGGLLQVFRFTAVYGGSLVANVAVNGVILGLAGRSEFVLAVAFVLATGVSATLNFVGMKFFVFRLASP